MRAWHVQFMSICKERSQLYLSHKHLRYNQTNRVFQAWQQVVVQMKLIKVQEKTSKYLYRKNLLVKSLHVLETFVKYRLESRRKELCATIKYQSRLIKKAFEGLVQQQLESQFRSARIRAF
jgi:hypothetical protein